MIVLVQGVRITEGLPREMKIASNNRELPIRISESLLYGAVGDGKPDYLDISNFPTSYYNPCRKDRWNVVCVVYDTTSSKSSLWVNHGKICDFARRFPLNLAR